MCSVPLSFASLSFVINHLLRMSPTSETNRVHRSLAMAATALGLWTALVLLFAAAVALTGSISWREGISFGASFWALWLLFLPSVAWFSFRFPIERKNLVRNFALHLCACVLVAGCSRVTFRAVDKFFPRPQRTESPGRPHNSNIPRLGPPNALGVFYGLRAALDVLVYWSLVVLCQAIANFRSSQERERRAAELEASLASAKLQALRMQINPHFLFNTLNSIASLVYVNPRAADEMLGDLSELLRRSLDSMEAQEIPLAQELEFIGGYIRIEQKRFGERLRVELNVPNDLMNALVPALILQPLVENAIRHGIEPRRGPGLISIEAKKEGKHLRLLVRDDGRGRPSADSNATSERRGIGLANTQARLQGLYGPDHRFTFQQAEPQGCLVDIYLPFHLASAPVATLANDPAA